MTDLFVTPAPVPDPKSFSLGTTYTEKHEPSAEEKERARVQAWVSANQKYHSVAVKLDELRASLESIQREIPVYEDMLKSAKAELRKIEASGYLPPKQPEPEPKGPRVVVNPPQEPKPYTPEWAKSQAANAKPVVQTHGICEVCGAPDILLTAACHKTADGICVRDKARARRAGVLLSQE